VVLVDHLNGEVLSSFMARSDDGNDAETVETRTTTEPEPVPGIVESANAPTSPPAGQGQGARASR